MGFPRIISKNNKIYTKLGDFCLSGDGQQFWIVCHTCQEELQTQDNFWKHIQDEHNFVHGIKQEQTRTPAYMEAPDAAPMVELPLYPRMSVNDRHRDENIIRREEEEEMQKDPKDYTEMGSHIDPRHLVSVDIKLEPSLSQHGQQEQAQEEQIQHQHQMRAHEDPKHSVSIDIKLEPSLSQNGQDQEQQMRQQHQQIEISTPALMYQIPHVHSSVSAYAALVQSSNLNTLNMSVAAAATTAASQVPSSAMAALLPLEVTHKEPTNNNTTGSASKGMTSDDGERWYICDFDNCGLKFKYQSRLELHRCAHSKERRFACVICGASFKQSCNLSTHRKKKHEEMWKIRGFAKRLSYNDTSATLEESKVKQVYNYDMSIQTQ